MLAVRNDVPKPNGFVTISPGSIITIRGEVHPSGLVSVLYDGQIVAAFMRDIEPKAEVVESAVSVGSRRE